MGLKGLWGSGPHRYNSKPDNPIEDSKSKPEAKTVNEITPSPVEELKDPKPHEAGLMIDTPIEDLGRLQDDVDGKGGKASGFSDLANRLLKTWDESTDFSEFVKGAATDIGDFGTASVVEKELRMLGNKVQNKLGKGAVKGVSKLAKGSSYLAIADLVGALSSKYKEHGEKNPESKKASTQGDFNKMMYELVTEIGPSWDATKDLGMSAIQKVYEQYFPPTQEEVNKRKK